MSTGLPWRSFAGNSNGAIQYLPHFKGQYSRQGFGHPLRGNAMTLTRVPAYTTIIIICLGVRAEAQSPCPELVRLRNEATAAWKEAMRASPSERCGALDHASVAAEMTFNYANNNRVSCNISLPLLNQVEGYHRQAVQARDNVCAGRPLRSYPADIIRH